MHFNARIRPIRGFATNANCHVTSGTGNNVPTFPSIVEYSVIFSYVQLSSVISSFHIKTIKTIAAPFCKNRFVRDEMTVV